MEFISGFGFRVTLIASVTFPGGIVISQFADDGDSIDFASTQIADKGMGVNGDMVAWSRAVAKEVTMNLIPGSDDDLNLSILASVNTPGPNRIPVRDEITMVVIYPDGSSYTASGGVLTDYMPGDSVASSGRLKTRPYKFAFESVV